MKSDYQCFDANTIKSGGFFSGLREGYVQTKNDVFQGQWYNTILLIFTKKDLGRHVVWIFKQYTKYTITRHYKLIWELKIVSELMENENVNDSECIRSEKPCMPDCIAEIA